MSFSTNARLTPGVYLTLKYLSEQNGMSIGDLNTFFFMASWSQLEIEVPEELTTALNADFAKAIAEMIKIMGMKGLKPNIAEMYQDLLNPSKNSSIA